MKTLKVNKEWFKTSDEKNPQAFLLSISSSVITENIIPWLTSFNNISFKESKTEEYVKTWFLDFGAKDMLIGIEAETYQSSINSLDVMIHLYRKNFEKIPDSYYSYFYLFRYSDLVTTSVVGGTYYKLSKNFFTIIKENNLIALFQGGSYDLPDGKDYIVFDEDNFGEKYIMLRGDGFGLVGNKDSRILYFNNEIPIVYAGKVDIQKYSKENYLIAKKMKINYYPGLTDFYALSTNILKIDNINLETDKDTAHKIIEVNGVRYRKIIYNIWIEDSED